MNTPLKRKEIKQEQYNYKRNLLTIKEDPFYGKGIQKLPTLP